MRGLPRSFFQRAGDHVFNLLIPDLARSAGARFVCQTLQTGDPESLAPLSDCMHVQPELTRNVLIEHPRAALQNDPGSQCQPLGCLGGVAPRTLTAYLTKDLAKSRLVWHKHKCEPMFQAKEEA